MSANRLSHLALAIGLIACATPSLAQPGWGGSGWGGRGWGGGMRGDMWGESRINSQRAAPDNREGKVDAAQFVAPDAGEALGHGPVAVTAMPGTTTDASEQTLYEAAVIDQLVKAGYDTIKPDPTGGQVTELRIVRDVLVPEEQKRKPVSGAMSVGVSNYGTSTGMAIAVDLTKAKKALMSTRMEARILDRATGKALWEGRAEIATREGDSHWTQQAIATRLAAALFDRFPLPSTDAIASR